MPISASQREANFRAALERPFGYCMRGGCRNRAFMQSFDNDGKIIEELCERHNREDVRQANAEVIKAQVQ